LQIWFAYNNNVAILLISANINSHAFNMAVYYSASKSHSHYYNYFYKACAKLIKMKKNSNYIDACFYELVALSYGLK